MGFSKRTMKFFFYKQVIAFCLLGFFSSVAISNDSEQAPSASAYECQLISRSEAINRAKKRTDGKVVGVQLADKGKSSVYRVRILVGKKRIKTLSIPACR